MELHKKFFQIAAHVAIHSLCLRDKCGSILVLNEDVIASGYNSPPGNHTDDRKCEYQFPLDRLKPKTDCTCCMHAEQRAIMHALKSGKDIRGSTLYFTRVDKDGEIEYSGDPYCTVCSRMAYDAGIAYWVLWHESGIKVYSAKEIYDLTYEFQKKSKGRHA
ncbi:MAG TPA: hypothetical protein VL576_00770 [Candidatus Paceibacterota bacterium]|nr:hypothetical protein [Candidatus Paceibacterota bacterium]